MKSLVWILFLGLVTVVHGQQLSMMSYNIKLDYPKEGENSWANRKPFFMAQIRFHMPDVLGVQEALPNQMGDMSSVLPEYSFIGVGRDDGKEQGEYSAIFYKMELFDVLDSGTFWIVSKHLKNHPLVGMPLITEFVPMLFLRTRKLENDFGCLIPISSYWRNSQKEQVRF